MLRFLNSIALFGILTAVTGWAWNHRFEEASETLRLAAPLELRTTGPSAQSEVEITRIAESPHLAFEFTTSGTNLVAGSERWQQGRTCVVWRDRTGRRILESQVLEIQSGSFPSTLHSGVIRNFAMGARVYLSVQNFAIDGEYRLNSLAVTGVTERSWYPSARVALAVMWLVFITLVMRTVIATRPSLARSLLAALIFLGFASWTVFPGPWYPLRPLGESFVISDATAPRFVSRPVVPSFPTDFNIETLEEEPLRMDAVSVLFRLKYKIRPLFHIVGYAGCALAFSLLLGRQRGWIPAAALAFGAELMQFVLGFGFDSLDFLDLLTDAVAIAAGSFLAVIVLQLHSGWRRQRPSRPENPSHTPSSTARQDILAGPSTRKKP